MQNRQCLYLQIERLHRTVRAGNLTLNSANINSQNGVVTLNADKNVTIGSTTETHDHFEQHTSKGRGFLSSKSTLSIDQVQSTNVVGSTVSGDTVAINANKDIAVLPAGGIPTEVSQQAGNISVKGSNVVSTNGTTLNAGENVSITSTQNTDVENHVRETKKSGLMGSGGVGFTIGSRQQSTTGTSNSTTNNASTVGSTDGDVTINTGKAYTQTGSDVLAPKGNINITAQTVDINAAQNTNVSTQQTKFKQTGITVSVSNPVISAVQTTEQMATAASQTSDGRMQALAGATTALSIKNAAKSVADNPSSLGGIDVSISLGTSKSQSDSTQTSSNAQGSNVTAGKDINITATGAGTNSNLNVVGSTIQAADNVTLKADNQVNLLAAQNTDTQTSTNKSSSASVGISVGSNGFAVTASMSKGKGNANGTDVTYTETVIQGGNKAGDKVALQSGTDTNLIGAEVKGNQVVANVGTTGQGNLNIQSLQDTSTYNSKQSSNGVSISVPIGAGTYGGSISASKSNINSDYASVNEQAGIKAGDAGFQVNVNGNTNLTGAVIASTQTAIDNNENSLTTKTLTTSDIQNKAEYDAQASSFSAGVGRNVDSSGNVKNTPSASSGYASQENSASSITQSAISGGVVNITDNTQQSEKTGQDALTTVATLNRDVKINENGEAVDSQGNSTAATLTEIFDQEKVNRELNAAVTITQAFSNVAPKAVADFAQSQYDKYKTTDPAEAAKWAEGGIYRIALHTALGGLITGDISGALGAGTIASAAPLLNELQDKITDTLKSTGLSSDNAKLLAQGVAELTSAGIGSAVGGTAGAGAGLAVDTNNRQLHPVEIDLARQRAKDFAKQLNGGKEPTDAQIDAAANRLLAQINRNANQNSDFYYDSSAQGFLMNVARDYAIQTGSSNIIGTNEPIFGLGISQESYLNSSIFSSMLNTATVQGAYQDIASVYNDPNKAGIYLPNNYWLGNLQDYNDQKTAANQAAIAVATCMTTRIGCSALSGLQAGNGVNQVQAGNNWGWLNIALGAAGGVLSTLPSGLGKLTIGTGEFSASERTAAQYMANQGYDVILRSPVGTRVGGGTSDLLVNGVSFDVYTPITSNPNRIVSAIASKNSQAQGVILDLRNTTITPEQLGNLLQRVQGAGAANIKNIVIIGK